MIDYRSHSVVLDQLRQSLAAATFGDPAVALKRDKALVEVAQAADYVELGALIDPTFAASFTSAF